MNDSSIEVACLPYASASERCPLRCSRAVVELQSSSKCQIQTADPLSNTQLFTLLCRVQFKFGGDNHLNSEDDTADDNVVYDPRWSTSKNSLDDNEVGFLKKTHPTTYIYHVLNKENR